MEGKNISLKKETHRFPYVLQEDNNTKYTKDMLENGKISDKECLRKRFLKSKFG